MNKQEAIQELIAFYGYYAGEIKEECDIAISAIERQLELENLGFTYKSLIEAREKQIPKKPLEQRYVNYEIENELIGHCPSCQLRWDVAYWQRYCSNCGQKLDWSVEE